MTAPILAGLAGLLFGFGLIVSGMTDPARILAFLDVGGRWNPSLIFVMAGAILAALPGFVYARRNASTPTGLPFQLPQRSPITARLVVGAAIFGVGWGLSGWCPGPNLVAASHGSLPALGFTIAMAVGWLAARRLS